MPFKLIPHAVAALAISVSLICTLLFDVKKSCIIPLPDCKLTSGARANMRDFSRQISKCNSTFSDNLWI